MIAELDDFYKTLRNKEKRMLLEIYKNNSTAYKADMKEFPDLFNKIKSYIIIQPGGDSCWLDGELVSYIKYFILKEPVELSERLNDYQVNFLKKVVEEEIEDDGGLKTPSLQKLFKGGENEGLLWINQNNIIKLTVKGEYFLQNIDSYASMETELEARKLLKQPDFFLKIMEDMDNTIIGEQENKMLLFLLFLSKISDRPQHILITGQPSLGKSHILNNVADYFGDSVEKYTRLTSHALDYMEDKDFNNKIVLVQEAGGIKESSSIRPLLSGDQNGLVIGVVEKDEMGRMRTVEKRLKGMPVFATSDIVVEVEQQFATRVWNINLDASKEQTEKILKFQREKSKRPWDFADTKKDISIITAVSLLEKKGVVIPFVDVLEFPSDKVRARRDNKKFIALIEMSTLLHQKQRPLIIKNEKEYIIATIDDLFVALVLGLKAITASYLEMEERIREFKEQIDILIEKSKGDIIDFLTVKEISKATNQAEPTIRQYMDELIRLGLAFKESHPDDKRKVVYYINKKDSDVYFDFFRRIDKGKIGKMINEYFEHFLTEQSFVKPPEGCEQKIFSLENMDELEKVCLKPALQFLYFEKFYNGYFEKNKPFYQFIFNNIIPYCIPQDLRTQILGLPNPTPITLLYDKLEMEYDYNPEHVDIILNVLERENLIKVENGVIFHTSQTEALKASENGQKTENVSETKHEQPKTEENPELAEKMQKETD